jgi:hypothetical protein
MTAVTHPEKAWYSDPRKRLRCILCGGKAEVPYIEWHGGGGTRIICAHCCRWSDGLVADLKTVRSAVIARHESIRMEGVSEARQ